VRLAHAKAATTVVVEIAQHPRCKARVTRDPPKIRPTLTSQVAAIPQTIVIIVAAARVAPVDAAIVAVAAVALKLMMLVVPILDPVVRPSSCARS
jgi:hypothetical protein